MAKAVRSVLALVSAWLALAAWGTARAETDAEALVEKARLTFVSMYNDSNYAQLKQQLKLAKAVLIVPSQLRMAFILGAEGGSGVLVARDANGAWGYPAFYTIGAGSLGLQAGAEMSEAVLLIMTESGLDAIISNQVKLGADLSMAIGPLGAGIGGSTTTSAGADVVTFTRTSGLYLGGSLDGAGIIRRDDWNDEFYGKGAMPHAIIFDGKLSNPKADPLRQALQDASQQALQQAPEQAPQQTPQQTPQQSPQQAPQQAPQQGSQEAQ